MRTLALALVLLLPACTAVFGVGGGLAGQKLGTAEGHPVVGTITGAVVGGAIGLLIDRYLFRVKGQPATMAARTSARRYATAASSNTSWPASPSTAARAP